MATSDRTGLSNEECVVQRLRAGGASSLEDLTRLPGLDWVAAFSIVDRLNRAGLVMIERNGIEYRVSMEKGI